MWITQGSPAADVAGQETTWTTARRCAAGEATISSARRRRSAAIADFSGAAPSSARIARRSSGLPFANEYNFVVVVLCVNVCVQFPRCCFVVMYKLMSYTNILYNICGSLEIYSPLPRQISEIQLYIYKYISYDRWYYTREKRERFSFQVSSVADGKEIEITPLRVIMMKRLDCKRVDFSSILSSPQSKGFVLF